LAGTWPINATPYDPTQFLEVSSASAPVTDFEGYPTTGIEPLGVTFMDLSTNAPTGWYWLYGDGSPTGVDQNPYHGYTGAGTYTVTLTSFNAVGSDAETKTDYIEVSADVPTAEFTANKFTGYTPLSVKFSDLSTSINTITGWLWTFGDGRTSTSQNPTHVYEHPGMYTVTLEVTNAVGKQDTEIKTMYITTAQGIDTLYTYDSAPSQLDELLAHMPKVGDANTNIYPQGIRFYVPPEATTPGENGFRRPAGPSLIFD